MTLDDIKEMIAGRLGQRTDLDAMIYREVRQAQRTLEKTPPYPWFLLTSLSTDYSTQSNTLPTDFIETLDDTLYILKATADVTAYTTPARVTGGYLEHVITSSTNTGRPRNFTLLGTSLFLYGPPDVSYSVFLPYYAKDDVLAGALSENLWTTYAEDVLIAIAGRQVARNIRDAERAAEFYDDGVEAKKRMGQETTSRLEAMRRAVIGSGEDALLGVGASMSQGVDV